MLGIRVASERPPAGGQGPADFVRGPKSDYGAIRELCETCPVRPGLSGVRGWPMSR